MTDKPKSTKVTVDGLELVIDGAAIEDIETLDLLDDVSEGNVLKVKKLMVAVFGDESWAKIREHLKGADGRVNAGDAAEFFGEALEAYGAKNS